MDILLKNESINAVLTGRQEGPSGDDLGCWLRNAFAEAAERQTDAKGNG